MNNELKFALKVWIAAVIGGSLLASFIMVIGNKDPSAFMFGLFMLFIAATRGIPSLIMFYVVTIIFYRIKWMFKAKIILLAILGALLCLTNIILILYRKKLEEILYLLPEEMFVILGFASSVVAAVFYFNKLLLAPENNDKNIPATDPKQQQ